MADPYYYPMDYYGQIAQYKAATGRYRPDLLEPAMHARLSAVYESEARRRALSQQQKQFEQTLEFQKSSTAVEQELARRRLALSETEAEAQRKAAIVSGTTQALTAGTQATALGLYGYKHGYLDFLKGGGAGTQATAVGGPAAYEATMASSGATVASGEATAGLSAGAGMGITGYAPYAGAAFAGGYLGSEYGPGHQEDVGRILMFQKGTKRQQSIFGGAAKGAGVGAAGFAFGPVVGIVTTIFGAIGGAVAASK